MAKARIVFGLQVALGAIAAAAVAVATSSALGHATWVLPDGPALWAACQRLVPDLDARSLAVLSLGGLSFAVILRTLASAFRRLLASRAVVRRLPIAERVEINGVTVHVFSSSSALAFCAGLSRPRVYASTGALRVLSGDELEAVIAHEAHHARRRDPLRIFVARVLGEGLFFAPALRRGAERYAALAELAADRAAVRARGDDPSALASALLSFEAADPAVVGIAPERVDHLLGDPPRWDLPIALAAWTLAAITAVGAVAFLVDGSAGPPVNLPLVLAQSCMLAMALAPLILVAAGVLSGEHLLRRSRR